MGAHWRRCNRRCSLLRSDGTHVVNVECGGCQTENPASDVTELSGLDCCGAVRSVRAAVGDELYMCNGGSWHVAACIFASLSGNTESHSTPRLDTRNRVQSVAEHMLKWRMLIINNGVQGIGTHFVTAEHCLPTSRWRCQPPTAVKQTALCSMLRRHMFQCPQHLHIKIWVRRCSSRLP